MFFHLSADNRKLKIEKFLKIESQFQVLEIWKEMKKSMTDKNKLNFNFSYFLYYFSSSTSSYGDQEIFQI